jgi:NTP pyrophosphatase (non-canonical NTP hydrolase)
MITKNRRQVFFWGGGDATSDVLGLSLGVCGEAGELAEKIKKLYFNKKMEITDEDLRLIGKEIGDTLWYLAALSEKAGPKLRGCRH